jgi:phage N-6-adenine-methyltransferase
MTEPKQKPGRSKQDYGTPPELLKAVKAKFGIDEFDCDLAASKGNAVCPHYLSAVDDALSGLIWLRPRGEHIGVNWCNPPFSDIAPWVDMARVSTYEYGVKTLMLIPAAVGSNWWRDHVHGQCDVYFLNPRITFIGCKDPYPKDCALLFYHRDAGGGYDVWTWKPSRAVNAVAAPVDEPTPAQFAKEEF